MNSLPPQIKAEIKFSTGQVINVPEREWKALQPEAPQVVGIIAVLCLIGDLEVDGEWILVDPTHALLNNKAGAISITVRELTRIAARQTHLRALRDALAPAWRCFLSSYFDRAIASRAALADELKRRHSAGRLVEGISGDRMLDCDHLENVRQIVRAYGEGVAGCIFQDLFAYLLGSLGYRHIVCNTIGVPDVTASGLIGTESFNLCSFNACEIARIAEVCENAGELQLADRLRRVGAGASDAGSRLSNGHSQMPCRSGVEI